MYVLKGAKTDSEVKILKKSKAGSFYGVIDDHNNSKIGLKLLQIDIKLSEMMGLTWNFICVCF